MSHHFLDLLRHWRADRDSRSWVLGTVYATEGPSYRKAGAMMLLDDLGQRHGLLSGGCLEADIHRHARQVMDGDLPRLVYYDGSDEDDFSFQLGIGCGGLVRILLQPVHAGNGYLDLPAVLDSLTRRGGGTYHQRVDDSQPGRAYFSPSAEGERRPLTGGARLHQRDDGLWLQTRVQPPLHLLVVGGGADAVPLVAMAAGLGWEVTLCDPRPANARPEYFPAARQILRCHPRELPADPLFATFDAAVSMTHNLALDAAAVSALQGSAVRYLATIGPLRRKLEILAMAGLGEGEAAVPVTGPAGLALGAELPEGVALSILAECHAVLAGGDAKPLSDPAQAHLSISGRRAR
ncbi:MAG: XdhC family protein [Bacteroidales bacterium]|nr:XdhC family protein [Bacteroidales bacterium]